MPQYRFVDLFAGCGGLSLGLSLAGMQGRFAIERDPMAFETLRTNLVGSTAGVVDGFSWPEWLSSKPWAIEDLLRDHKEQLISLRGQVEVLAGGPPCQGFSFAGRRHEDDPRNMLFEKYVEVVDAIRPMALVVENVPGMRVAHSSPTRSLEGGPVDRTSFYEKLRASLESVGYSVHAEIVDASKFGVPQRRARLIVFAVRNDLGVWLKNGGASMFDFLEVARLAQLETLGLPEAVSASAALSDLEATRRPLVPCQDPESPKGFEEISYQGPETDYQRLMHARKTDLNSLRLARHRESVKERFASIIAECPQGVRMNDANRSRYGLKKHRIYPMSKVDPAPTITTLPDDILHYSEPRILTVRECARLQSFPDWFQFKGKFTTGGDRRRKECPRYTQVGNAVPPYLGRAIGIAITTMLNHVAQAKALFDLEATSPGEREVA